MDGVASPAQDDAWANDRDREPPVSVQVHQVLLDDGFRSGIGGDALRPRARRGALGDGAVRETRVVDRDRRRVDEALDTARRAGVGERDRRAHVGAFEVFPCRAPAECEVEHRGRGRDVAHDALSVAHVTRHDVDVEPSELALGLRDVAGDHTHRLASGELFHELRADEARAAHDEHVRLTRGPRRGRCPRAGGGRNVRRDPSPAPVGMLPVVFGNTIKLPAFASARMRPPSAISSCCR